jgi:hemolysin-activating ACP:hemolysin acyltransferase
MAFRKATQDRKSGEILWLLAVLAFKVVAQALVNKLEETVFKDKTYKRFTLTAELRKAKADSP